MQELDFDDEAQVRAYVQAATDFISSISAQVDVDNPDCPIGCAMLRAGMADVCRALGDETAAQAMDMVMDMKGLERVDPALGDKVD